MYKIRKHRMWLANHANQRLVYKVHDYIYVMHVLIVHGIVDGIIDVYICYGVL